MIGSIHEYLYAPDDPEAVIEKMADPEVRIVSLTVTEGGYNFDAVTGEFDADNPDVRPRPAARGHRRRRRSAWSPRRWPGVATAGCRPFTMMSCDNIQGNGRHRAAASSPRSPGCGTRSSAAWVEDHGRLPEHAWWTGSPR